jgi:hypothetical protein
MRAGSTAAKGENSSRALNAMINLTECIAVQMLGQNELRNQRQVPVAVSHLAFADVC